MVRRGIKGSGLEIIGVGAIAVYEELVYSQHKGDAKFVFNIKTDPVEITITGKAVFDEFKPKEYLEKIKFICNPPDSFCTILSELTDSDIYLIIRNFYFDILDNCLGKMILEEQEYVFRFNKPISMIPWSSDHIEKSEEYIRNLPESSVYANLEDLAMQIKRGILEYAFHAKDESGVKMHQYADVLLKKL